MLKSSGELQSSYKNLVLTIGILSGVVIITGMISQEGGRYLNSSLYVILTGILVFFSIKLAKLTGHRGYHGIAHMLFAGLAISRFVGEQMFSAYDLLNMNPWPSEADFFFMLFYGLFFVFSIFYIKPFQKIINKKKIALAISIAIIAFIPSLISVQGFDKQTWENSVFEIIMGLSYTIADSIILAPTVLALILFFEGKVNFLWSTIFFGIICLIVGDNLFLIESISKNYATGHILDLTFFWTFLLFTFGIRGQIKYFGKSPNHFVDQHKLK